MLMMVVFGHTTVKAAGDGCGDLAKAASDDGGLVMYWGDITDADAATLTNDANNGAPDNVLASDQAAIDYDQGMVDQYQAAYDGDMQAYTAQCM